MKLTDNFNSDVEASHLGTVGVGDGGVSVVGSAGQEPGDQVGDLRDDDLNWGISSVGAGVEGSGAGLAVRDVSRTQEVRELGEKVVNVVGAEETGQGQRGGHCVLTRIPSLTMLRETVEPVWTTALRVKVAEILTG